ncbi:MAG: PQQ-dependent sugar dehydrogenase [Ferruginibacter sp.]
MSNIYIQVKKLFSILLIVSAPILVAAQPPVVSYVTAFGGLNAPVDIVNAGDGSNRLFVVEQGGTIKVRNGVTLSQFANFGPSGANIISTGGERGLLSMAFHPDYNGTTNRYFFIYYTDVEGDITVSRYETTLGNINTADLTSRINIISIAHPGAENHNGGKLNFGSDGYLYFATGDGGGGNDVPNNAQTGTVLLGKMLRIDIDNTSAVYGNYDVPPDNPYVNDNNIDDRIWALGLRNPFRWSFDRVTGDMWIGDVGQGAWEEINYRAAGSTGKVNYGWRCFEGYPSTPGVADCTPVNYIPPVYDYPNPPDPLGSAVTGGYVYRGSEFPAFVGYYIATDVYSGDIFLLWPNGSGGFDSTVQTAMPVNIVVGFGEGEDGTLYAVSQATNTAYKVVASGGVVLPITLGSFSGIKSSGYNELKWKTAEEQSTARFYVEYSKDGISFTRAGTVPANRNAAGSNYTFRHYTNEPGKIFYRLAIQEDNGSVSYSDVINLSGNFEKLVRIYPTVINNGQLKLDIGDKKLNTLKITNTDGRLVYKRDLKNSSNTITVNLPSLAKGIYMVEIAGDDVSQTEKIVVQ